MLRVRLSKLAYVSVCLSVMHVLGAVFTSNTHAQSGASVPAPAPGGGVTAAVVSASKQVASPFVESLLSRMTLQEKLGQLTQWSGLKESTGPHAARGTEREVRAGQVGSFMDLIGAETTRRMQRIAVEDSRLHIPLLFAYDVIHGFRTVFPVPLAEAASWNMDLAQRSASAAAVEASAWGVHWTFAPMVDVARDARWGRLVEGAGEDPFLGSAFAVARTRGFQSGDAKQGTRLIATAKHFIAYGAAEAGRDYNLVDVSERALREVYAPPFQAAIEAGVDSVMVAFNEVAGVPMHAHANLVRGLLRDAWGFRGVVASDYTGILELIAHGVAADPVQAAELGINATVDVDMISNIYLNDAAQLVKRGDISAQAIDDSVRRVLTVKERLGLFEDPFRYTDPQRQKARTLTPEARALAREAAQQAIVLLKNEKQLLPLRKDIGSIAVVGSLADDGHAELGSWWGAGEKEDVVPILAGIREAVSAQTRVTYARGASPDSADRSQIERAVQVAKAADVVIAVVGETAEMTGESTSRSWLGLPGAQSELLERLVATGRPVVAVLANGRPLELGWLDEHVPAIMESWFLGVEAGHGLADVLFGDVNPSGKLPITFPRNVGQVPLYYAHKSTGRPPDNNKQYTSRYIDVTWTPLYPFGYGLSYTRFQYDPIQLSKKTLGPTDTLQVKVTVRNVGSRTGTETVQLYLRDEVGSTTRPLAQLRGFERVALEPGAARELTFTLDQEDFALLDEKFARVVEAGAFTVMVGPNVRDVQQQRFEITGTASLPGPGSAIPRMLRR